MWFSVRSDSSKKMADAYMTVEATVVFPLMIFAFAICLYLIIFIYDKTLLSNDTQLMALYSAEYYEENKDTFLEKSDAAFSLIKSERPYLSLKKQNMSISKHGSSIIVDSEALFSIPIKSELGVFYKLNDITLTDRKEMTVLNPSSIMLMSDDILRSVKEQ